MRKFLIVGSLLVAVLVSFGATQNPGLLLSGAFTANNCVKILDRFHVADAGAACGSGGGGVVSFNTRTGAVVSANNDYAFSQISGVATPAQLPVATNAAFGAIKTITCAASNWISSIGSGTGIPGCSQPNFTDIAGTVSTAQIASAAVTSAKLASGAAAANLGSAGGDLSGTYPNPSVVGVGGAGAASANTVLSGTGAGTASWKSTPNCGTNTSARSVYTGSAWNCKTTGLTGNISGLYPEPVDNNRFNFDAGVVSNSGGTADPAQWSYVGQQLMDFRTIGRFGIDGCAAQLDTGNTTTSSTINGIGTGTGSITVASSSLFVVVTTGFAKVGSEFISFTVTNSTTLNVTGRALGFSTAVAHANGSTLTFVAAMPACDPAANTGPITVDSAWYAYALWCDGQTDPSVGTTIVMSQTEVQGNVIFPSGCNVGFVRQLPFGIVYRASCNVANALPGIPPFLVTSWPGGAEYYFPETNTAGCYDVQAATVGVGSFNDLFTILNCPNQFQRSGILNIRVTASTGAGSVFIRPNGDNTNIGEEVIKIGVIGDLATAQTKMQMRAGNHYTAGRFQLSASSTLTVGVTIKGCGAATQ